MAKDTIILSLGGSLIVPESVDVEFLRGFRALILEYVKKHRFAIITGGGRIARVYAKAAADVTELEPEDQDWLGIHCTRLNAHLVRTVFRGHAHPRVIKNPTERIKFTEDVLIAAGWKPGCSTDYDAVLLAKNLGVTTVINLTNIDYVYDRDPKKYHGAKRITSATWADFRKIVGDKWDPGLNAPFDPIASKHAQELGLKVIIANGKDLENLRSILSGKRFRGTVIKG